MHQPAVAAELRDGSPDDLVRRFFRREPGPGFETETRA